MQLSGKNLLGLALIGLGALIILNKLGLNPGGLFGVFIPIILIFLGYIGMRNGKTFIGVTILIIGLIALLGQFAGIIGFIIAVAFVVYGVSLLRKNANSM